MGTDEKNANEEEKVDVHPVKLTDEQLLSQSQVQRTRRGGPGGQHRNKVESAIVITHLPTGVVGQASERRSQHANRDVALARLRMNLALAVRADVEQPSELWKSRISGRKIQVSSSRRDFSVIIAELLDFLFASNLEVADAANRLEISSSQLIKLLKQEPSAWEWVMSQREKRGLHRLK